MREKKVILIIVLSMFCSTYFYAKNISETELKKIREYPQSVVNRIDKYDAEDLLNDEYFLQTLVDELKSKGRKTEDKVYFFYLMMQKIGWAFCGGITVPFSYTYPDFSLIQSATLYDYYQNLSSLKIDSKPFFNLAFKNVDTKPILASYAFLLGSLLEPDATAIYNVCEAAYKNNLFSSPTLFRSMLIHNIMLISPVIVFGTENRKPDEYSDFLSLLQKIFDCRECKEEEKEDIMIASIYDENYGSFITPKLLGGKNNSENFFILTSVILIKERLNSIELFKEFIDLWENHETEDWKKEIIKQIKDNDYAIVYYYLPTGWLFSKSWDGVSLIIYDDGCCFKYDDYLEFLPNKTIKH